MDIIVPARQLITLRRMLSNGEHILVGLSGGPDSVALLHVLTRLKREYSLQLHAVYINHGMRPKAAAREEVFCRDLCQRWHVRFSLVRSDIPSLASKRKVGFEEAARDFRYRTFERLATELSCSRIALGHQADDQVETVLFRILRGTGRTGLAGIPAVRGKIIRPLLEVPRVSILSYLNRRRLRYMSDDSNADISFRRNYLREKLLPLIRREVNPNVDRALRDLSRTLGDEEAFLAQMTARMYRRVASLTPGGKLMLDLQIYLGYPLWLRRRVLRAAVAEFSEESLAPDKKVVDRIDTAAQNETGSLSIGRGLEVEISRRQICLRGRRNTIGEMVLPVDGQWHQLDGVRLSFRAKSRKGKRAAPKLKRAPRVALDARRLGLPLKVRGLRPGDRFAPLGMTGQKKVGDYLTDRKVPVARRDEIAVVCDDKGIVWLVGWEIADRVKIEATTTEVMNIEYRNDKTRQSKTV